MNEEIVESQETTEPISRPAEDLPMEFPGDPMANNDIPADTSTAIDPNGRYKFGDVEVSGQEVVQLLMNRDNTAVQDLQNTVTQLAQQVTAQQPQQQQAPENTDTPPETQLSVFMNNRFNGDNDELDTLTPQDFVQGMQAMQADTTRLITDIAAQVNPQQMAQQIQTGVQQQLQQNTQQIQTQQQKEQAVDNAVNMYVQSKAQAMGVEPETIRPAFDFVASEIKDSGRFLLENDVTAIGQFAMNKLTSWDRYQQSIATTQSNATVQGNRNRDRQIIRESQRMVKALQDPNTRGQVMNQSLPVVQTQVPQQQQQQVPQQQHVAPNPYYTRTGQIDEDAVLQHTKTMGGSQRY